MAARMPDNQLERALVEIGARLEEPPPVDLASAVGRRLRSGQASPRRRVLVFRPRPAFGGLTRWRTVAVAAAAVIVLVAGVLVFSPGAREAVAGWLGLRGVRIEVTPQPPPGRPSLSPGPAPNLGPRVSLAEAERQVGFEVLLPSLAEVGRPDEIHVQPLFISDQVFLVYRARPGLPAADATGVGLLVSEFRARLDEDFYKKISAGPASVEFVMVRGEPGYWIEGLHEVSYLDRNGVPVQDSTRIAGNVLLWERGDITLRLESALSLQEALRIARSFG
jgi:hypothetical protein